MNSTLLDDGSVLLLGGQDGAATGSFVNGIPWVKRFRPGTGWQDLPPLLLGAGRWYPGLARLNDGRLLMMGGGMAPNAARTDTCEVYDPDVPGSQWTGSLATPVEFPPAALLHTGEVLQTWGGQPQLYDPLTGQWTATGNFTSPARGWPGHSDHSLLVLSDGRALAVGLRPGQSGEMTEFYEPATGTWSAGTSPSGPRRMQAEVVHLPDGKVLVAAGDQGGPGGGEPQVLGIVRRADLFDPVSGVWRRVADLAWYREYHAVTVLLHDGRVATTGGTRIKFQYGPTTDEIEAYRPPYLFRGVRPRLDELSDSTPARGETVSMRVFPDTRLTGFVLMGMQSTTHWVDGGVPRRLELPADQLGSLARMTLPTDPDLLPEGWYLLFGMVDDIPSVALSLRVTAP
jgi:hypothetical protein